MQDKIKKMERRMLFTMRGSKRWHRVITALSCLVVFSTVYSLILPAITLSKNTVCGLEEHIHGEACYSLVQTCGMEEGLSHSHDAGCYTAEQRLICTQSEEQPVPPQAEIILNCSEEHEHTEDCWITAESLSNELAEGHIHIDGCYETQTVLICEQSTQPHVHTENCEELVLTCGMEEHTHAKECYEAIEHSAEDEAFLARLPRLTGHWAEDFVKTARSQLTYAESTWRNEDGTTERYTMYGAFFGRQEVNWDAAFAAWCLQYTDIPPEAEADTPAYFPQDTDTADWLNRLNQLSLLHTGAENWNPQPGDLVFFTYGSNRQRLGILTDSRRDAQTGALAALMMILGDWEGCVDEQEFSLSEINLSGWARLPENPDLDSDRGSDEEQPDAPASVPDLMEWTDSVGAIARPGSAGLPMAGSMFALLLDDSQGQSNPLPLGDTEHYGDGAGYITKRTIHWRDPADPTGKWIEYKAGAGQNISANAEFRLMVEFIGVDKKLLKEHGYQLEYTAESILTNFTASGVIRNEDGQIVGEITACQKGDENQVILDFSHGSDWVDGLGTVLESEFYYQGQLDLQKLENAANGIINIAGIDIQIPDSGDAVAEFASVDLEKQSSGLIKGEDGHYYIEYTLTVTAGEYGCPDVKLLDMVLSQGAVNYLDGYVGVDGTAQTASGPASERPLDKGSSAGSVYLTNTTPEQITDKIVTTPTADADGNRMAWVIGNMQPNETHTLTYRVAVKDSYIGIAHKDEAITNTASLFSKSYERGTKVKTFTPTATAAISKKRVGEARIENGKYIIDYEVVVTADSKNSYPLTDVKVSDFANQNEGTEYAGAIKLVEGSVKLGGSATELDKYKNYTDAQGNPQTRANPRISANNRFDVFVGNLNPGQSRTITYTLELDIQTAQQNGNGALGIFNCAYVYSDEVRQNKQLNTARTRDTQSYNQWVSKTKGNQTATSVTTTFPAGAEIYDATTHTVDSQTGKLPTITGVTDYTIPAGAYAYTVKINQSGDWDVTAATWKDTIQTSDNAGNRYMRFLEYVRVDVYNKLVDSTTGQTVVSPDLKKTVWVKIDDQWEFAFTGKQIGMDGSDAYVLTYYTEAILPEGVTSYGTINANNQFNLSGQVGNGSGIILNPNISQTVTVTAKEPGVNDPVKVAWYYDAEDDDFASYHNGESNGALYWVIKVSGNKIPKNMQFQESTRLGALNNYLRNNESLLGFYIVNFPEGTDNASNADEFLERYKSYADFEADLHSEESNIRVVPKEYNGQSLYTQRWTGFTDKRHGDHGKHFDLTLKFEQDYTISAGEALYLLIKTDPIVMPGNGEVTTYNNKCNYRTDAMGSLPNWPTTQTSQVIVGPEGSLNKNPGNVYVVENAVTDGTWDNYINSAKFYQITANGKVDAYTAAGGKPVDNEPSHNTKQKRDLQNSVIAVGHSVDELKALYNRYNSTKQGGDTAIAAGNGYRITGDQYLNYAFQNGTYVTWTIKVNQSHTMSGPYFIEDVLPEGVELSYVRLYQLSGGYGAGKPVGNVGYRPTSTYDFGSEWTPWTVVSNRYQGQNWADGMVDYYTNGNSIKMYLPNVEKKHDVSFQIVARLTDEASSELMFGDVLLNNQVTLYDRYNKKIESSGAEVRVTGGNVNKQILMDGKFNPEEPEKLNSTVFPYRIAINSERVDMAADSDVITVPLNDRMTGNMTMELDTLRIYALPEGQEQEDTSAAGDKNLIYYGGSYTSNPKAVGRLWYTTDADKLGKPLGFLGKTKPAINVFVRPAVDSATGAPLIGPDGSVMQEVVFENLPDATHLIISYSVSVKLKDGNKLIFDNKAFWQGHEENSGGDTDTIIKEYQAGGSVTGSTHGAVHIVKYDADSYSTRLEGAEFALYRAEYKVATAGYAYLVDREIPLTQDEINKRHWIAVYVGSDYSKDSQDPEIPCRRNADGELIEVRLKDSSNVDKWMTISEAYSYGYTLHHDLDTNADGSLKLCSQGPLAMGETDANGNLSYGFGDGKDFGKRFQIVNGKKEYLDDEAYSNDRIRFNKVYAVKEVKAPEGYELDETPHFFVVPNAKYDGYGQNYFYHEIWPDEVHICVLSENDEITYMLNAANTKRTLSVSKDFAGSVGAARPGTYSFGLWASPLTASTKEGMVVYASITYTEEDFDWYTDEQGNKVYGVLPDRLKTVGFPSVLNYGTYYIYELNASGNPILESGMLNGYSYTPEFSGESKGEAANQLIFNADHDHINVTNRGYSIEVEKNFLDLDGNVLENGLQGEYKFAIWPANQIGEDGMPTTPATLANTQTITWERGDTQLSKTAQFTGLSKDTTYFIFELDADSKPIPDKVKATLKNGSFVVYYSTDGLAPSDNTATELTVSNAAFVTLPQTGGMGTDLFIYGGIALMSLACLGYTACTLLRRRRKEVKS